MKNTKTIQLPTALAALLVPGAVRADTLTNVGLSIHLASPTQVEIGWDTATNAGYRLEYCSTLTTGAAWATNRFNVTVTP